MYVSLRGVVKFNRVVERRASKGQEAVCQRRRARRQRSGGKGGREGLCAKDIAVDIKVD